LIEKDDRQKQEFQGQSIREEKENGFFTLAKRHQDASW
jgi:hypothetical protein